MKLTQFRVREFRSVWDSDPIDVDDRVTCLVGKNESGKTALLTALYRTNPILPDDGVFNETYDYPKREVEDYLFEVENEDRAETVVVECTYELDDEDKSIVSDVLGPSVLESDVFKRKTFYGERNSRFILQTDDQAAINHLANNPEFNESVRNQLLESEDWASFATTLESAESSDSISRTQELVSDILENGLQHYVFNKLIWPRAPIFLYFDEYYQMQGCANLNSLIEREEHNALEGSDYPLIGLINLARLDYRQLVETRNTTELKNKLEGASNHLTRQIINYWSQNKHILMQFDVRDAKQEDPEGMQDGINVWAEIYDTVHLAHTALGSRSKGFVWFFSFLAWYEDIKRKRQNVILLLDEPGLSLHGKAQGDLLEYFEQGLSEHQLIYTTHSPFMIDPQKFERVRIVQDSGIDSTSSLPKEEDGTKVLTDVLNASKDSLFPLQGALGYEIQQTLFVAPNSLVVEGPSDLLYIQAISTQLDRDGRTGLSPKWVITPVGGVGRVPAFVSLLAPQKGMNIATLLDIQDSDRQLIEGLYKKKILSKNQVLTYADFTDQNEADVEDLFERRFYVSLVNGEYAQQLNCPINIDQLNDNVPRTLKAIDLFLDEHPLKSGTFNHYRPARYLSDNIVSLWSDISNETRDSFEAIFERLNRLLQK